MYTYYNRLAGRPASASHPASRAGFLGGRQVLIEMSAFYPMQFDIGALVTIFHCHSIPVGGFHTMV